MEKKNANRSQKNSNFNKGDFVNCYNKVLKERCKGKIIKFKDENSDVYALISFVGKDPRLDDWYPIDELEEIISKPIPSKNKKSKEDYSEESYSDDDNAFTEPSQSENENDISFTSEFSLESDQDFGTINKEEEDEDEDNEFERVHKEITKKRNIESITIGKHTMRTWHYSPYPPPFHDCKHLFICEHCFLYFKSKEDLEQHIQKAKEFQPCGREIYRNGNLSIFEMKGNCQKLSCQCLCLLGKLFLDYKTLYYDTEGFSFYVLCEMDKNGYHSLGYSSREVNTEANNILSCIVIFPSFQKKGYGRILIALSYEIARRKKAPGSPEKPLSDLGEKSFESFWRERIINILNIHPEISNIELIVDATGISEDDIKEILEKSDFAKFIPGKSKIVVYKDKLKKAVDELKKKKIKNEFNPRMLLWNPNDDLLLF